MGMAKWKDPWTGQKRPLFVYGVVPYAPAIGAAGVLEVARLCTQPTPACSTAVAQGIRRRSPRKLAAGQPVEAEVNGCGGSRSSARPRSGPTSPSTATSSPATRTSCAFSPAARRALSTWASSGFARGPTSSKSRPSWQDASGADLMVLTIDEMIVRETDFLLQLPADQLHLHARGRRRLPGRLRDRLPGALHRREQPPAAVRHAQGDRLLRRLPAPRCLEESLILSVLGYLPGAVLAWFLYAFTVKVTNLPMQMTAVAGGLDPVA